MVEPTLRLKSIFIGHDHVANRIGLQTLPYELVRIVIWRIELQIKWSQFFTKRSHEVFLSSLRDTLDHDRQSGRLCAWRQ